MRRQAAEPPAVAAAPRLRGRCPRRGRQHSGRESPDGVRTADNGTALLTHGCSRGNPATNARVRAKTRRGTRKESGGERSERGAGERQAGSRRVGGRRAPLLPGCTVYPSHRGLPRDGAGRERRCTRMDAGGAPRGFGAAALLGSQVGQRAEEGAGGGGASRTGGPSNGSTSQG